LGFLLEKPPTLAPTSQGLSLTGWLVGQSEALSVGAYVVGGFSVVENVFLIILVDKTISFIN